MNEELFDTIDNQQVWAMENIQDKVQSKLANIFSFYNEQEFLDEIHGIEPARNTIESGTESEENDIENSEEEI